MGKIFNSSFWFQTTLLIIVPAALFVIMLIVAGVALLIRKRKLNNLKDGSDEFYPLTVSELYGKWIQTEKLYDGRTVVLKIDNNSINLDDGNGKTQKIAYEFPDNAQADGTPLNEIKLKLNGDIGFESLIFHKKVFAEGGEALNVLSGTIFEYDGRGEIVVAEFVKFDDIKKVNSEVIS